MVIVDTTIERILIDDETTLAAVIIEKGDIAIGTGAMGTIRVRIAATDERVAIQDVAMTNADTAGMIRAENDDTIKKVVGTRTTKARWTLMVAGTTKGNNTSTRSGKGGVAVAVKKFRDFLFSVASGDY